MIKFQDNFEEFERYLKKLISGAKKIDDLDGDIIVKDSVALPINMYKDKTKISQTDKEAIDEYEYELVRRKENEKPVNEESVIRFMRDIIKDSMGEGE